MGRKSTVKYLDPNVREELDAMIRDGRATIDQMKEWLDNQLGDDAPSRAAVGRYKQSFEKGMEIYRISQDMAKQWGKKLQDDPDSSVAKLALQVLSSVALNTAQTMISGDESVPANELMFAGKALDHIARAEKTLVDRELKIRDQVIDKAVAVVEETARAQGMDDDQVKFWREKVLGIR